MKKYTVIITIVAPLLVGTLVNAQSTPTPTPTASDKGTDCKLNSWNTELYGFGGDKDTVKKKLKTIPAELLKRRVFVQLTEGDSKGEVKLFERQANSNKFTVTRWSTGSTSSLLGDIDKTGCDNKGVNCIGEQVGDFLRRKLKTPAQTTENFGPPTSTEEAFGSSVDNAKGNYIRMVVFGGC
jgi:hypothetical protein